MVMSNYIQIYSRPCIGDWSVLLGRKLLHQTWSGLVDLMG